jgi:hypothetical protein
VSQLLGLAGGDLLADDGDDAIRTACQLGEEAQKAPELTGSGLTGVPVVGVTSMSTQ